MRTNTSLTNRVVSAGVVALLALTGLSAAALATAGPASAGTTPTATNQTFAFPGPTGFAQLTTVGAASSPSLVLSGANFAVTTPGGSQPVPTTNSGVPVNYISGNVQYYEIPAGATYVSATTSGPLTWTGGPAPSAPFNIPSSGSAPVTITECTTSGQAGCTAAPNSPLAVNAGVYSGFGGPNPTFPYLQVSTGSTLIPAGSTLTLPSVVVTLTATGGPGTVLNWSQFEFDTQANVHVLGQNITAAIVSYPSAPYAGTLPVTTAPFIAYSPPPVLTSTSILGSGSISAVLPNSGPLAGGSVVRIMGTQLISPSAVTFGATPALSFSSLTATSIQAVAPPGAGTVDVRVTNPAGTSSVVAADQFTYTAGPIVSSVTPRTGVPGGGTVVGVSGLQLTGATSVTFGAVPAASFHVNSDTSITATAPAGTGVVDVQVTNPTGTSVTSQLDQFNYRAGYRLAAGDGGVFSYPNAPFVGSAGALHLNRPVVGMATTPDSGGYWLVASDGGVFAFGDATFFGSMGGTTLNRPIVGMASTSDGFGYWLVAADGGVFAFGDAVFHGSHGGTPLNKPIVGLASTPDGGGYWMVAADGGVFAYGDAVFHGSLGGSTLGGSIVGIATTPGGTGYWLAGADGGVFAFGGATFAGSAGGTHLNKPVVGIAPSPDGGGYWLAASDGGVFTYGDATYAGSQGGSPLNAPIVGIAAS